MYWDVALWSAGIWAILSLAAGQLTEQEKLTIVDMHNKLRSQVQPSAAFMQKVVWDETLRVVAEAYATKCIWENNPDLQKLTLGENLFVSIGPFNATEATVSWFGENVDYNYENKFCPEDKICDHYTQMVWANSTRIGCATHFCETLEGLDSKATILVCDYYPQGNVPGQNPYVSGEPCSKCPENLPLCEEKICVRENLFHPSEEPDVTEKPGVTEDPTVLPELSHWTTEPVDGPRESTHVPVEVDERGMEKTTKSHGSKMERVSSHLLMLILLALVL